MHDLVCLLRREQVLPLPHADEGHRVDQQRHPEVPRGEAGPHERVEQVGGGGELALETMIVKSVDTKENASYLTTLYSTVFLSHLLAQFVELSVLGEEREPVRHDHGLAQVVQQVGGAELPRVAVVAEELVSKESRESHILEEKIH